MTVRIYNRSEFRAVPPHVDRRLASLGECQAWSDWPRDDEALAREVRNRVPFTVVLFSEPLAREHWRFRRYVEMRRVRLVSELDEIGFREFGDETNRISVSLPGPWL
jgi:hypothetical protein